MGVAAEVEFFKGTFSKVYLLDAVKDFERFIPEISKDSEVIFIDFEYVSLDRKNADAVCLFQLCNSSGTAFLFRQRLKKRNKVLKKFLSRENGLKFVANGIPGDMARLKLFFYGLLNFYGRIIRSNFCLESLFGLLKQHKMYHCC